MSDILIEGPFNVFTFSPPGGPVSYYAVADWDKAELSGERDRGAPAARFDVSRRHKDAEQRERALWFCNALNKQWQARQAIKLQEAA